VGAICLLGLGIWLAADPSRFQSIVTSKPLLSAGASLILAMGVALLLLGFVGCFGALQEGMALLLL
ncbi:unnamed protein product, partial [Eretmochelys imbricata]